MQQRDSSKETLTEVAIQRLTNDIVEGVLVPEQKLLIAELKQNYRMGASPLREALARLSSLGFVTFDRRRGFRVAPVSRADLDDITLTRQIVETAALRRAMADGGDDWEVGVVAAYTRLELVVGRCADAGCDATELESTHKQFHTALIAGCGSQRLTDLHSIYYDQASRYRQVMLERTHALNDFLTSHKRLATTVLSRKADEACAMLSEHISITQKMVYPEQKSGPAKSRPSPAAAKKPRAQTAASH